MIEGILDTSHDDQRIYAILLVILVFQRRKRVEVAVRIVNFLSFFIAILGLVYLLVGWRCTYIIHETMWVVFALDKIGIRKIYLKSA